MDLNQLLFHHQLALIQSAHIVDGTQQGSHFDLVGYYRKRIIRLRREMGVHWSPDWL